MFPELLELFRSLNFRWLRAETLTCHAASVQAKEIFMAKFGNLVEVPPTNIHVDVPASIIHIEKATLKPEAFRDLHLPVTFSGGSQFRGSFMQFLYFCARASDLGLIKQVSIPVEKPPQPPCKCTTTYNDTQ